MPSPQVAITASTSQLYEGTSINLTCSATLDNSIDTDVSVTSVWTGPNGDELTSSSRFTVTNDGLQSSPYESVLMIDPADDTDTGDYQCSITVSFTSNRIQQSSSNASYFLNVTGKVWFSLLLRNCD